MCFFFEGPDEDVTTAETHRETIEIQHAPQADATPTPDTQRVTKTVHIPGKPVTKTVELPEQAAYTQHQTMYIEEIPSDLEIPEDTTFTETIEVQGKPKVTKPKQVEIRLGMPKVPGPTPTTAEVIKETTTYTTITSEIHETPEEIPQIKEGQETRTTTITFDKQPGIRPVEFTVQVPEKPKKTDVISASETSTTTVTKEVKIKEFEDLEKVPETHTETIEITKETEPQEVELLFKVPKEQETPLVSFETEVPTATKRIEVEVQETVMQQKPKPVEIKIPKTEKSVTEITMKAPGPQVETQRPEVEQIEETRPTIEKVSKIIPDKAEPQKQEVVFEIPAQPETAEEIVPMETEIPAPSQPQEVVEREVIKIETIPEAETKAPEVEMEISERDTIQIVKEPVEETVKFEFEVSESVPEVTETVSTETLTEKSVFEQEVPQVQETHKEEITLDIKGKPRGEVQLSFQVQPKEKQIPEMEEIQTVERTSETVKEIIQLPEAEETPRKEVPVFMEEKPEEKVSMLIDVKEVKTTEIEEFTTTEEADITKETELTVPSITETHKEEITLETKEKPIEDVKFTVQVETEKSAPVTEVVRDVEQVSLEMKETVQVPEIEETHKEEITFDIKGKPKEKVQLTFKVDQKEEQVPEVTEVRGIEETTTVVTETVEVPQVEDTERKEAPIDVTDRPREEVTMTIQIGEKEVPQVKEITQIETTEITKPFAVEVPEVEERHKEEITIDTQEKPMEAVQFQIQIPQKEVPQTEETTQIETTETTKTFTIEVPEVEERHIEEITVDTHERPTEAVQFQIQIGETEIPETTVVTETETTTETILKTIQLPSVDETHREELALDISQKPKTIQMEIEVPAEVQETVSFTTEVTEEAPEEKTEVRETTREEITLEIKGKPVERKEMEIKIPIKPREETETSPKQISPLIAPTTEEIFESFEEGAPEFTWGLVNLKVMDGEEAKFRCEVQASPTPEISWFHDEKPITENQDFR